MRMRDGAPRLPPPKPADGESEPRFRCRRFFRPTSSIVSLSRLVHRPVRPLAATVRLHFQPRVIWTRGAGLAGRTKSCGRSATANVVRQRTEAGTASREHSDYVCSSSSPSHPPPPRHWNRLSHTSLCTTQVLATGEKLALGSPDQVEDAADQWSAV